MITIGYIHCGGDTTYVRVFYDSTFVPGAGQTFSDAPLVNNANAAFGPTGFCLLTVNTSGGNITVTVLNATGAVVADHVVVGQGNPVTTGQARSRTAAQMATLGLSKRGDVGTVMFE